MLIVVQRRSDGKYYLNGTKRYGRREEWTDDINEVKPFLGLKGVTSAFAPNNIYWGQGYGKTSCPWVADCCKEVTWNYRGGFLKQCEHFKAARAAARQKFISKYRLFEVALSVRGEVKYV